MSAYGVRSLYAKAPISMRLVSALTNHYNSSPWVRAAVETVRQIKRDDVTLLAAGVAYYAVLSLFPLTLLLLSILRLFVDSASSRARLEEFFAAYLPDSIGFVDQISAQGLSVTGVVGIAGFLGLLWSGTAMMSALSRSVNLAFGNAERRPFYRERPLTILFGLGLVGAFALSLFGSAAIESASQFDVPVIGRQAWLQVLARFLPFGVTMITFVLVYRLLPQQHPDWRHILPAAILGTVLFELAKVLFLVYLNRVASFEIYGSMALLVILMVWSYFSAFVVLVGAELVSVRRQFASLGSAD